MDTECTNSHQEANIAVNSGMECVMEKDDTSILEEMCTLEHLLLGIEKAKENMCMLKAARTQESGYATVCTDLAKRKIPPARS